MTLAAPSPPPPRSQLERRETARAALLAAAIDLWAEKGPDAFTLADVGKRAGYSRGEPRHYFATKAGLVQAVIEELFKRFGGKPRVPKAYGLDPLFEYLESFLKDLESMPNDRRAYYLLFGYAHRNPEILRRLQAVNAGLIDHLDRHLKAALDARELDGVFHHKVEATLILLSIRGLANAWMVDLEGVSPALLNTHFMNTLKLGLRPRTA
jgi:AcrR family transcriptional regulator